MLFDSTPEAQTAAELSNAWAEQPGLAPERTHFPVASGPSRGLRPTAAMLGAILRGADYVGAPEVGAVQPPERPPTRRLTAEQATVVQRLALVPVVQEPKVVPAHEHETCSEVWTMAYALGTHRVTSRLCKQRCRCGAERTVVWPPVSPGCKPIGFGDWRAR
jgi:hypothetical protein